MYNFAHESSAREWLSALSLKVAKYNMEYHNYKYAFLYKNPIVPDFI